MEEAVASVEDRELEVLPPVDFNIVESVTTIDEGCACPTEMERE